MTFINNTPEQEHTPTQDAETRDTDPLHQALQDHISKCDHCRETINSTKPRGFGQRSRMCKEYFKIVNLWATGEFTRDSNP